MLDCKQSHLHHKQNSIVEVGQSSIEDLADHVRNMMDQFLDEADETDLGTVGRQHKALRESRIPKPSGSFNAPENEVPSVDATSPTHDDHRTLIAISDMGDGRSSDGRFSEVAAVDNVHDNSPTVASTSIVERVSDACPNAQTLAPSERSSESLQPTAVASSNTIPASLTTLDSLLSQTLHTWEARRAEVEGKPAVAQRKIMI